MTDYTEITEGSKNIMQDMIGVARSNERSISEVQVYHDGKNCRNVEANVHRRQSGRVLISFTNYMDEDVTSWFRKRRRSNGGVYECVDSNYWYYGAVNR